MYEKRTRIRAATAADIPSIRKLLLRSYGDTYPYPERLDAAAMRGELESGETTLAVATDEAGEVVGHAALEQRGRAGLFEYTRAIVSPEHRGSGLLGRIGDLVLGELAPLRGVRFVSGQVVTSHLFAQRFGKSAGFVTSGLLLGCVPQTMAVAGIERPPQPISELVMLLRVGGSEPPRRLAIRGRDHERAAAVLDALSVAHGPALRRDTHLPLGAHFERHRALGVVHLRFAAHAPPRRLQASFVMGLEAAGTRVLWADVPVEHPGAPAVLEQLRELGLGFAAYLPLGGPDGEDVLRYQRYLDPTPLRLSEIQVLDELRPLRDEIYAECQALEGVAS
jgi:predicted N-acetyltransferase YhbS